jgi:exosortase
LVWTLGGSNVAKRLIFPVAYLALMVPLPFVDRYTLPLAMFTGVCSGGLVRLLGLDVEIIGNAVKLPNADLVIGAQCSGVNSLIALTALMILAAYLVSGPTWGRITLVLLSVPLALLGNILRVASLLFVAREWGAQAGFVFYHDYSGLGFFVVVLALMLPLTRLVRCYSLRPEVI